MSAISVVFESKDTTINYTFIDVINILWSNSYSTDQIVSQTNEIGQKITTFTVKGFIEVYGDPSDNVIAQQAIETAISAIGTGTLKYTGATDISEVRFTGLSFDEYRGNPVGQYTATFVTEAQNVHAHAPVTIGALTLSIANGFEPPSVSDSVSSQGPDEQVVNNLNRSLDISGRMVGSLTEVNTAQSNLVAEIENKSTLVVGVSSGSGGYLLTVRPGDLSFGSPEQRVNTSARSYAFTCKTHEDYTKEPYVLGEAPLVFGSGITLDVVGGQDHNTTTERNGSSYEITEESFNVSGKKYFVDWTAYTAFVDSFRPIPTGTHFLSTNTNNSLELVDVNVGDYSRDGNFADTTKRYVASVTLTFKWKKGWENTMQSVGIISLGINWRRISSTNHGFSIDNVGAISNRNVNLSGQVTDAELANAKGKIGTAVVLGDSAIPGGASSYYITSLGINKTDVVYSESAGGNIKIHEINVSANQLDTNSQRNHFLSSLFVAGSDKQLLFDKITGQSKSISNRYLANIGPNGGYRVSAITMNLSGEIWEVDSASSPANPNRGLDFFNLFDATYTSEFNPDHPAQSLTTGEFLPTNYSFFLNNMSFGDWIPFTKENDPGKGTNYWKQSVNLSATAVFDLEGGGSDTQPDFVDTKSFQIGDEITKFTELQVMGFGTVFKAIGINPSTAQTIVQRQYKDSRILQSNSPSSEAPPLSLDPPANFPFGSADREQTKDTFEVRGLTARWTLGWKATKAAP